MAVEYDPFQSVSPRSYHVPCRSSANGDIVDEASSARSERVIGWMDSYQHTVALIVEHSGASHQISVFVRREKEGYLEGRWIRGMSLKVGVRVNSASDDCHVIYRLVRSKRSAMQGDDRDANHSPLTHSRRILCVHTYIL